MANKYPNTSSRSYTAGMQIMLRTAFRGPARLGLNGRTLPKSLAVVVAITHKFVRVVTHDLLCIERIDLNFDDFCRLFTPDPCLTGRQSATKILTELGPIMIFVPPAGELLQGVLGHAEETKVKRDKTKTSKSAAKAAASFTVYGPGPRGKDHTCIVIDRDDEYVTYITLHDGMNHYLCVGKTRPIEFDQWFQPSTTYPLVKLAAIYMEYALNLGATHEALDVLGKIIHINDKEYEMAVSKKSAADAGAKPAAKTKPAEKSAAEVKPAAENKPAAAKPSKPAVVKEAKPSAEKKPSAAQRFQELIMEGKKTDDEIFAVVQKEFGLDDSKKSYVKWYRNHLTKQGKNPPDAKAPK